MVNILKVVNFAPVRQITDVKSQHEPGGFFLGCGKQLDLMTRVYPWRTFMLYQTLKNTSRLRLLWICFHKRYRK